MKFAARAKFLAAVLMPVIIMLFLAIFSASSFALLLPSPFIPYLLFSCIYFWKIHLPKILPYWFLFLVGVVFDALINLPLGFSSFFLIIYGLFIVSKRPFLLTQNRLMLMAMFLFSSTIIIALQHIFLSLYYAAEFNIGWVFETALWLVLFYIIISKILDWIYSCIMKTSYGLVDA